MKKAQCMAHSEGSPVCLHKDLYDDINRDACKKCGVVGRLAPLVVVHVPDKARESAYVRIPKETQ